MKILFTDLKEYEKPFIEKWQNDNLEIIKLSSILSSENAELSKDCKAVCCFVNDKLDRKCLNILSKNHCNLIILRCAGFNNIDIEAAKELGIKIARVPAYSPHAVAEFALAMILTWNRKTHRSFQRTRDQNFSLEGLVGFDIYGKTIGIVGLGKIGKCLSQIMLGMGCKVLAYDPIHSKDFAENSNFKYVEKEELLQNSDIISLHMPLNNETKYFINSNNIHKLKANCLLVNTGRGALIESKALINALKKKQIAGACLDVYELEEDIFFHDHSTQGIDDEQLLRLISFPNVLVSSHQAFLTTEALQNIFDTSQQNLMNYLNNEYNNNFII